MKTPEEIKAAVLKEFERLCPNPTDKYDFDWGYLFSAGAGKWSMGSEGLLIFVSWDANNPELNNWQLAYRLLNLEAKELEEMLANANNSFLCQMAENVVLEERAKELVDALEKIKGLVVFSESNVQGIAFNALNRWKGVGK